MGIKPALIQVYTGDGKGKTTAACGLALRAAAHGLKVGFFRFFKPARRGEATVLKKIKNVKVYHPFPRHPAFGKYSKLQLAGLYRNFPKAWEKVQQTIRKEKFDLVVLDEILIALRDGFLPEEKLILFLENKDEGCELVLTGRKLPPKIAEKAQLISEIKALKHPFPGIKARKGIEF